MKLLTNIIRNFSSLTIGQAISGILNFFAIVFLARRLSANGFGIYSFAESTFMFFLMFIVFGTDFLGSRKVAQDEIKSPEFVAEILGLRFIMSIFCFLGLVAFTLFLRQELLVKFLIIIFGLAFFTFVFLLNWLFLGLQNITAVNLGNIVRDLVFFLGTIIFVHNERDILKIGYIFVISRWTHSLFLLILYKHHFGIPKMTLKFTTIKNLLFESFPILFSTIEGWIVTSFDLILMGIYLGTESVGYYNAAFKPIFLLITISMIYYLAIFPLLSKTAKHNIADFRKIIKITLYGMLGVWFPVVIVGYQLASWIIGLMYGQTYSLSVPIFKFLLFSLIITPINALYSRSLISSGKQKENSYVSGIIIFINIVLNIILIPKFGLLGAAFAKVAAWVFAWPFYHKFLSLKINIPLLPSIAGPLIAAAVMIALYAFFNKLTQWERVSIESLGYLIVFAMVTGYWWNREKKKSALLI